MYKFKTMVHLTNEEWSFLLDDDDDGGDDDDWSHLVNDVHPLLCQSAIPHAGLSSWQPKSIWCWGTIPSLLTCIFSSPPTPPWSPGGSERAAAQTGASPSWGRLSHIKVFTLVRLTCEKSLRRSASSWPTPRGQQPPPYCTLVFLPFQKRATTLAQKLSTCVAIIQPKEQQIHIFTKMTSAGTSWISAVSTVSGCICRERNCTTGIDSKSQQADGDPRKEDGERWVAGCPRQHWTGWGGRPPNRVQECAVVHPKFYCASRIITLYTLQRARLYGPTSPCACLPLCHL